MREKIFFSFFALVYLYSQLYYYKGFIVFYCKKVKEHG